MKKAKGNMNNRPNLQAITPEMVNAVDARMEEFTEQIIDMDMTPFVLKMEGTNVGELRVIRLYLEQRMMEVNAMTQAALNSTIKVSYTKDEALTVAQLFVVLAKIEAKRGVIDHFLMQREITK